MRSGLGILRIALLLFIFTQVATALGAVYRPDDDDEIIILQREISELRERIDRVEKARRLETQSLLANNISFSGRIHMEYSSSNNEGKAYSLLGGNMGRDRRNTLQITSMKFGVVKKLTDSSKFVVKVNSAKEYMRFSEVYWSHSSSPKLTFDVGEVTISYTLETENSYNAMSTAEYVRFYPLIPFPGRGVGVKLKYISDNFGVQTGYYGNSYSEKTSRSKTVFNLRLYGNTYRHGNDVVHFGFNSFFYDIFYGGAGDGNVSPSESGGKVTNLKYDFSKIEGRGLEFAVNKGQFNLQTEYRHSRVGLEEYRTKNREMVAGYMKNIYVRVGCILTGETMRYSEGSFGSIKVEDPVGNGGFGAFEVVYRLAGSMLSEKEGKLKGGNSAFFDYGNHRTHDFALNWMPVDSMRFIIQYSRVREKFHSAMGIAANNGKTINRYETFTLKSKIFF
jgi:phosphate-selective porin OprO/OprP